MKWFILMLAVTHGALHLLGFAKGMGLAQLPQLQLPITRAGSWAWLVAALLLGSGGVLSLSGSRYWGLVLLTGVVLSQLLIFGNFKDAKFGTIPNLLLVLPALVNAVDLRPTSLRSEYLAAVERVLAEPTRATTMVTEDELRSLPPPVRRYLERVGVVGKPHVYNVRVRMLLHIRGGQSEPWMTGSVEQYNTLTPLQRFFFLAAKRGPVPVDVAHLFDADGATMRARVLGLYPLMNGSGPELTRAETVTILNDICLLAPAALLDPRLEWGPSDANSAEASLSHRNNRVSATLYFSAAGDLENFVSHDRGQSDGKTSVVYPWWTPVSDYRSFDGLRLPSAGEAQWEEPSGLWTYARVEILDVKYNVSH